MQELKKKHGSGTTTLIVSSKEMNDILKIAQARGTSNVLLKGVPKIIKNETKDQRHGFLGTLVGTLGSNFWEIYYQRKKL